MTQSFHFDHDDESYEFTAASGTWTDYLKICCSYLEIRYPGPSHDVGDFVSYNGLFHRDDEFPSLFGHTSLAKRLFTEPKLVIRQFKFCIKFEDAFCKFPRYPSIIRSYIESARFNAINSSSESLIARRYPSIIRSYIESARFNAINSSSESLIARRYPSIIRSYIESARFNAINSSSESLIARFDAFNSQMQSLRALLDASNNESLFIAQFDPASHRRLLYPDNNFNQGAFSLNQINAPSSNRSYFHSSVVFNFNTTQWSPYSTRVEEKPRFNRPRLTETFLAITSQTALTMLTIRTSGSTNFSQNAKILFCSAAAFNVIGFLSCLFAILLCGRKTGVKARIVTGTGFVFTAYGFLAIMGMLLNDDMMLWVTGLACIACFPALASAFMK
ncbi:hypothetical protein ACOSQ4_006373 [Xanthoceras sorbifolium]